MKHSKQRLPYKCINRATVLEARNDGHLLPAPIRPQPTFVMIPDSLGRPFMTAGGKTSNVRVKRVESDVQMSAVVAVRRG